MHPSAITVSRTAAGRQSGRARTVLAVCSCRDEQRSARWSSVRRASRCCCICRAWKRSRGCAGHRQEQAGAVWTRCRGGSGRHRAHYHHLAGRVASLAHLGSGRGDGAARPPQSRCRRAGLFLRSAKPVAARHQREHQRAPAPVLSQGTDLSAHGADTLAAVAATLNGRPRKTLGWRTPAEALDQCLAQIENHGVATTG